MEKTKAEKILDLGIEAERKGDYQTAKDNYEKSAKMGNIQAAYKLGDAYYDGLGTEQDYDKAFNYYHVAQHMAEMDYRSNHLQPEILYRLSLCSHTGRGIKKNELTALDGINEAQWLAYRNLQHDIPMSKSIMAKMKQLREEIIAALDEELVNKNDERK